MRAIEKQDTEGTEQLLSAAGFNIKPADSFVGLWRGPEPARREDRAWRALENRHAGRDSRRFRVRRPETGG